MKTTLLLSVLGVILGGSFGAGVALSGVESSFGFISSDPEVFSVEESEMHLWKWTLGGSVVGVLGAFLVASPTDEELLKRLARTHPHNFTPEALVELGALDNG